MKFAIPFLILVLAVGVYFLFFAKGVFYLPDINPIESIKSNPLIEAVKEEVKIGKISLEQIFGDHENIATLSADNIRMVIATGDVISARSVNYRVQLRKNFKWPFEKTAAVLKASDITFINLETPLIKDCPVTQEGMIFCGSSKNIEGLVFGGVDVASLANNHSANHGKEGIDETVKLLSDNGISTTGVYNNLAIKEVRGLKFAFLGYSDIEKTPLVSIAEEEKIRREILGAKQKADIVIVTYHWGREYVSEPDERQKSLGRLAIDSGADLVIGNHPHWIKPVEIYHNKLITYAHGNFIFDQEWSQKTKEGVIGKYTFFGKDLLDVEYLPVEITEYGQPYFLEGEGKRRILEGMFSESLKLRDGNY